MEGNTLYLECFSGISGDMTVAALLDLGADREVLLEALDSLGIGGYEIKIGRTEKCGIDACDFDVILDSEKPHDHSQGHSHPHVDVIHQKGNISLNRNLPSNVKAFPVKVQKVKGFASAMKNFYDKKREEESRPGHGHPLGQNRSHDVKQLHGLTYNQPHGAGHPNGHNHPHAHGHAHAHGHSHGHSHGDGHEHTHEDGHRNLGDISRIIDESGITPRAKELSKRIFEVVARAEAKAHGLGLQEVHFHEVGAVDSIVDIVAAAVCIDNLNIQDVVVSELYEGTGHVKCQHGILPVPVPAVVNILAESGLPMRITDARGEMVTPTGAAIAAALRTKDSLPNGYIIRKIGIGAGKKNFPKANVVRAYLIDNPKTTSTKDAVFLLETNLDDCTGENLGYTMEKLFSEGANDVFYTPIFMKKNRPAYKLSVICREEDIRKFESLIFRNTTSIGIRRVRMERDILEREIISVDTCYGPVRVKVSSFEGEKFRTPEYEDIRAICKEIDLPYKKVFEEVTAALVQKQV